MSIGGSRDLVHEGEPLIGNDEPYTVFEAFFPRECLYCKWCRTDRAVAHNDHEEGRYFTPASGCSLRSRLVARKGQPALGAGRGVEKERPGHVHLMHVTRHELMGM